ncbi:MAG: hypothetical protein RSB66_00895 [Clostridium sp.]
MNKNKQTMDILNRLSIKITQGQYPGMPAAVASSSNSSTLASQIPMNNGKKLLMVITGCDTGIDESIAEAKKLKDLGYILDIALSESAESLFIDKVQGINPHKLYTAADKNIYLEMIEEADAVIVPVTTQNTAIKLSLGLQDSFISMLLWQTLWQGKTLFMNMDNLTVHRGMEPKSKMLLQMMSGYSDKLKRLGVKPIATLNLASKIHSNFATTGSSVEAATGTAIERTVITEKDILKIAKGDTLTVHPRTIVTSLAHEAARNLEIKIVKQNV